MYHSFFYLVTLLAAFVTAQTTVNTINIRGKVTSKDKAVAGAVVTLTGQNLSATTNSNGEYSITKSTASVVASFVPQTEEIAFKNGVLELSLQKTASVKIEVFDIDGNLVQQQVSKNTPSGVYRMNIAGLSHTPKIYLIRASVGEKKMNYRYIPLGGDRFSIKPSGNNGTLSDRSNLAKMAAVVDSLKVVKEGYTTKVVAIESYDAITNITIDSANNALTTFVEDAGYDCTVSSPTGSNGGSSTVLPDPFTKWDGTQVKTMDDWRCRRREIATQVEKLILGEKAAPPSKKGGTVTGSVTNTKYTVDVKTSEGSASFSGTITLPATGKAPYPAVIVIGGFNSLNSSVLSSEGIATISYNNNSIASEASGNYSTGLYFTANPSMKGKTGALVAWAWGVSRMIDLFEKYPDVIDPTKIAIHGCSRLGKAAFVIGAFDQRIALGLPYEPGTGGAAPLRSLSALGGQTLSSCNGEASWFGPMSKSYSASMPVDMSDVAVMYAPRGLLLMDNPHIDHLAYKANYLGCAAAYEVFKAMGKADALWYLGNSNNGSHCSVRTEYETAQRAMIRKFLKGDTSAKTGGLDKHNTRHGTINVDAWTSTWKKGTITD